mgnify:CR=1 FL=1
MTDFDHFAEPQGRHGYPQGLVSVSSARVAEKFAATRRNSVNFAGSADYCRPHS